MKSKSQIIRGVLLLALLMFSGVATPFLGTVNEKEPKDNDGPETPPQTTKSGSPATQERRRFREMDRNLLEQSPKPITAPTERFSTQGESWDNPPGDWWNTSWEYRVNVTITEPGIVSRTNWPVTVQVDFTPSAYEYSIRVVNASSGKRIPSQPWNLKYATSHYLSSAKVTFLVNIPKGLNRTYQVYWSVDSTDPPGHPTLLNAYETDGAYHIKSKTTGYEVIAGPKGGGKVINVTHLNGDEINHEIAHFGITLNGTTDYGGYKGDGATNNNEYASRGFAHEGDP
nr:hypothetical protein [Candidatus Korarchaeota archaeon]NIU83841.1 hypothetical protein [Candidatus Thorarchaeota archaeon]NIW13983.1 hypothetical protein [Candidatus Thorarchaeota archaeon]NIW53599.1 hypothetical protein [Candidatus Korarchaeota archaeon]